MQRAEEGDTASSYFKRTEQIAGVKDMRFQALMPDVLHWLGITKIDRFLSMSHHKYEAIVDSGIKVLERVPIPETMIPEDSKYVFCILSSINYDDDTKFLSLIFRVEIDAKIASGYFSAAKKVTEADLVNTKGRNWDDIHH